MGLEYLFVGDNNGPRLTSLTEHLLGLEELTLIENHIRYSLGRGVCGVEDLFDSVEESDGDLGWVVVGSAFDLELTSGVGVFGLASVALLQELHARGCAWVQGIELDPNP
jgi:hypothetical protein